MPMSVARALVTPGDPAGIGPDIVLSIAQRPQSNQIVAVASPQLLRERMAQLGLDITLLPCDFTQRAIPAAAGSLHYIEPPIPLHVPVVAGRGDPHNSDYVLGVLDTAVTLCRQGTADAMVTGPVNKHVIVASGVPFTGHTEYLAEKTSTDHVVMLLANPKLRVALATTHLPLRNVADAIHADSLATTLRILHAGLRHWFNIDDPHILVCGLNPHAGENGALGHEELTIITPCLERLKEEGLSLEGPLPADTLFTADTLQRADAVLAMYHDQGLPVLKSQGFGETVNITLGLPIIRTSVDHGTAFELAGTGRADANSLQHAIDRATAMARSQGLRNQGLAE